MNAMTAQGISRRWIVRISSGAIMFAVAVACADRAQEPRVTTSVGLEGDAIWVMGHDDLAIDGGEMLAGWNATFRMSELVTKILERGASTFPKQADEAHDEPGCLVGESLHSALMQAAVYDKPQRDPASGGWNVRARLDHERALSILRERPEPESALATWLLKDERWSKFARAAVASEIAGIRP